MTNSENFNKPAFNEQGPTREAPKSDKLEAQESVVAPEQKAQSAVLHTEKLEGARRNLKKVLEGESIGDMPSFTEAEGEAAALKARQTEIAEAESIGDMPTFTEAEGEAAALKVRQAEIAEAESIGDLPSFGDDAPEGGVLHAKEVIDLSEYESIGDVPSAAEGREFVGELKGAKRESAGAEKPIEEYESIGDMPSFTEAEGKAAALAARKAEVEEAESIGDLPSFDDESA